MFPTTFLLAVTSVYLSTSVFQLLPFATPDEHNAVTAFSFGYGLLFALSTVDTLYSFGQIDHHVPHENVAWVVSAHAGGLGFSFLATVPFLKNLSITSHTHLTPAQLITFILFGALFLWLGYRQVRYSLCEDRQICDDRKKCLPLCTGYAAIILVYGFSTAVVFLTKSEAHFHLHHAISAAFLSIFWTDFGTLTDVITNGVLVGVCVQGISFYGIGEAYLWIVDEDTRVPLWLAAAAWGLLLLTWGATRVCHSRVRPASPIKNRNVSPRRLVD